MSSCEAATKVKKADRRVGLVKKKRTVTLPASAAPMSGKIFTKLKYVANVFICTVISDNRQHSRMSSVTGTLPSATHRPRMRNALILLAQIHAICLGISTCARTVKISTQLSATFVPIILVDMISQCMASTA